MLFLLVSPGTIQAEITNVGIDSSLGFVLNEGFVAVRSSEARSGQTDFNGDGEQVLEGTDGRGIAHGSTI